MLEPRQMAGAIQGRGRQDPPFYGYASEGQYCSMKLRGPGSKFLNRFGSDPAGSINRTIDATDNPLDTVDIAQGRSRCTLSCNRTMHRLG